ncbi:MAG: TlpA family protein disulfide reductase [Vicinamibacteria bacterium]|nr:TlpA family protein disulfide reductase [Vicinamibacteria bacterium]
MITLGCTPAPRFESRPAPPFDLVDLKGGRTTLTSLRGKILVLDFWATWCGPCHKEIPHYARLAEKNQARGVEVVGIIFDEAEEQEIKEAVRELNIPYRQLIGVRQMLTSYQASLGFPTTFVVDRNGVLVLRIIGSPHDKFARLQQAIDTIDARAAPQPTRP